MAREAVKKTLRLEDDTWAEQPIKVEIAAAEFARGALRAAYRLKLHGEGGVMSEWVAKRYIKSVENENKLIEEDIKVQVLSKVRATICSPLTQLQMYADQYNKHGMPKAVDFVVPFLMSLDGKNYCVEPYISGEYKKHSNNRYVALGALCRSDVNVSPAGSWRWPTCATLRTPSVTSASSSLVRDCAR